MVSNSFAFAVTRCGEVVLRLWSQLSIGRKSVGLLAYLSRVVIFALAVLMMKSVLHGQLQPSGEAASLLEVGRPVEADLAAGAYHSYRIQLGSGDTARILLEPQSVDLLIALSGSNGKEFERVGSAYGAQEPVSALVVAKEAGTYTLTVLPTKESAAGGHYKIELKSVRRSIPQDEAASQAQELFVQGQDLHKSGTAESRQAAIEKFEQSRVLFQQAGDGVGKGQSLDQLASLENELGDNQKAVALLEEALGIFRGLTDRRGMGMVLNDLGSVSNDLGDNTKALAYLNEAVSLNEVLEDKYAQAASLQNIGNVYENVSDGEKALNAYDKALSIRRGIHDRRGEAQTLSSIGVVYYDIDENQKALEYYMQALPLQHSLGDLWEEAATLNNMGSAYDTMGDKAKALESFSKSLPLKRATGNRKGEGTTLSNMCWLEFTLGEWQSAFDHCAAALEIRRAVGDRQGEAVTLSFIGSLYDAVGEQQKALDYFGKALERARAAGNREWEGIVVNNTGLILYRLGDYRNALSYYDQALSIRRSIGDRNGEAATLNNMGRAHDALGEKDKALELLNSALQVARDANSSHWEGTILGNIGWLYAGQGDNQNALVFLNKALPIQRTLSDQRGEASILYGIARVERSLGDLSASLSEIESALKIIESLRTKVTSQQLRASYFSSVQEYYQFYIDLLMQMDRLHPSDGYSARALLASEQSKARSLLDSLGEARVEIRQGVDPQLLEHERSLQQLIDGKTDRQMRLLTGKHTEEQAAASKAEIDELLTEYESVETELRQKSPGYAALTQIKPLRLEDIQKEILDQDTILLEYALGEERSYVWSVTPSSLTPYELPKRAEIEDAAKSVYELLKNWSSKSGAALGDEESFEAIARLSRMVLSPVASSLQSKRVLVVGDGALQYVPFSILSEPSGDQSGSSYVPLIAKHEIVNLPSASTLAALRLESRGRDEAPKLVAVIADPVFDKNDPRVRNPSRRIFRDSEKERSSEHEANDVPFASLANTRISRSAAEVGLGEGLQLPRLVFSRREAHSVLASAPAGQWIEALDFDANKATATSENLSQYRIVHFATHGLLNSEHPELSGLVLSLVDRTGKPQNGFLQLTDIYNLKLSADLIVLSACETALGKEIKGEGLLGLTRGFMYAGAPRVVASLWNVDDVATAEFMGKFYRAMLLDGLRPSAALQKAQLEMKTLKRWSSPYYWGAFVLQGDWN